VFMSRTGNGNPQGLTQGGIKEFNPPPEKKCNAYCTPEGQAASATNYRPNKYIII